MKIERHLVPETTIDKFAEENNLVMEIKERDDPKLPRYYACFKDAWVKDGIVLSGKFGDGKTEEEAIRNYACEISLKLLVVGVFRGYDRREIQVPRLI